MPISRDAVMHVARLAHVGLQPHEVDVLALELSSVLDHMTRLQEIDTSDVPPTSHVVAMESVMREDEVRPSWPQGAVLANAPHRSHDCFEVQAIFD